MTGRDWVLVGVAVVVGLALVGSQLPDEQSGGGGSVPVERGVVENDPSTRPGDASVYARIEALTDCVELQREFDIAIANAERLVGQGEAFEIARGYSDAAYNRAREVGCYG